MNLTFEQIDALKELVVIGVGRAAGILNEMVHHHIQLQVPNIKIFSIHDLEREISGVETDRLSAVQMKFKGSFSGATALVFPQASAAKLVDILSGEEQRTTDMDSVRIGTLTEVGNILINGVMGSIGNVLKQHIEYSIPVYVEETIKNLVKTNSSDPDTVILLAQTRFTIEQLQIEGEIVLFFESSFNSLLSAINQILEHNHERNKNLRK